jgi:parvulin-like peptidyl-prolyl isomerase
MVVGGLAVVAVCLAVRYYWGAEPASAQVRTGRAAQPEAAESEDSPADTPAANARSRSGKKPVPDIVASVNGRPITREELAQESLRHYGKQVLEALTNKYLIMQECQRKNIRVTQGEVDAEIQRMAKSFSLPVDQWLKLLKQERGIDPEQYGSDIIWPTLALRKLAGDQLSVSQKDLMEAFEMEYGPAVRARLISCRKLEDARKVQALAAAKPEEFGELAKQYSADPASASIKGLIPPIRRHGAIPEIEQAAFGLADGGVSKVISAGGQYVILKREGLMEARPVKFEDAAPRLEKILRDRKLRSVADKIFKQLQDRSVVEIVLNDPVKSRQMPGVAAVINGAPITLRQLADECIDRHGTELLEGSINRKLIDLACKQQNITVSEREIDAEIARAATQMAKSLPDGSPDVQGWLKLVTEKQGISVDVYRRDAVWPSVALRKLVGEKVNITEDDMRKGFEANYGPRVRCRAIVMNNLRRAQQVWEAARKSPTAENFGELAAKNSIEGSSRALLGEVPPIRKHGGQPVLEKEAFALKPGEISGVIQVDDKYVILFCEGHTKPVEVDFASVKQMIYEDIRDKKHRLAMADYFERLQDTARVDNYLTGESRSPEKPKSGAAATTAGRPGATQR